MKEVMKTNIYDVENTIIIVGSCLKSVQPVVDNELIEISKETISLSKNLKELSNK